VYARQLIFYFTRNITNLTYEQIGLPFGKDHATVINGIKLITEWVQFDPKVRKDVEKINIKIGIMKPLPTTPREAKDAIETRFTLSEISSRSTLRTIYQDVCQLESLNPEARLKREMLKKLDTLLS